MLEFEWDEFNVAHLAQHGISPDEVEEVEEVFGKIRIRRRGGTDAPDRVRIRGRTEAGCYLTLIVQQKGTQLLRPITGWDMRPSERELYDRQVRS